METELKLKAKWEPTYFLQNPEVCDTNFPFVRQDAPYMRLLRTGSTRTIQH